MKILRKIATKVQPHPSETWPAWTDDYRYVPTEVDEREASAALNVEWHDFESHPTIDQQAEAEEAAYREAQRVRHEAAEAMIAAELERMASEAECQDQLERGLRMF